MLKRLQTPTIQILDGKVKFNTKSVGRTGRQALDLAHFSLKNLSTKSIVATREAITAEQLLASEVKQFTCELADGLNCLNDQAFENRGSDFVSAIENLKALQTVLQKADSDGDYCLDGLAALTEEVATAFAGDVQFGKKKNTQAITKNTQAVGELLAKGVDCDFKQLAESGARTPWADFDLSKADNADITFLETGYVDQIYKSGDAAAMLFMAHAENRVNEREAQFKAEQKRHDKMRDEAVTQELKNLMGEIKDA